MFTFSRWRISGQISIRNIVPMLFRTFFAYLQQRGSCRANLLFLYVYLDNKTVCLSHFRFFPIFQDSWKIPRSFLDYHKRFTSLFFQSMPRCSHKPLLFLKEGFVYVLIMRTFFYQKQTFEISILRAKCDSNRTNFFNSDEKCFTFWTEIHPACIQWWLTENFHPRLHLL